MARLSHNLNSILPVVLAAGFFVGEMGGLQHLVGFFVRLTVVKFTFK